MSTRKRYEQIITQGIHLLMQGESTLYDQKTIVDKLTWVGKKLSVASFNKAYKGKRVGDKTLKLLAIGLQEIIQLELGYEFDDNKNDFIQNRPENWQPTIIKTPLEDKNSLESEKRGLRFYESGRMTIADKVKFMASAQQNITIVGIRLRQFCEYFTARSDAEFKDHIVKLLEKGVNIDCYLLDPESNRTLLYFEDRAQALPKEKNGEMAIKDVIKDFKTIIQELEQLKLKGKLNLFTYKHIPQNYFFIIDKDSYNAKMQVSHYLYGVLRSKTPVFEISKKQEPALFKLYIASFKAVCGKHFRHNKVIKWSI